MHAPLAHAHHNTTRSNALTLTMHTPVGVFFEGYKMKATTGCQSEVDAGKGRMWQTLHALQTVAVIVMAAMMIFNTGSVSVAMWFQTVVYHLWGCLYATQLLRL